MTPNKYAALRATIARAKRHNYQKVVMRVSLAEELLDQLEAAERAEECTTQLHKGATQ